MSQPVPISAANWLNTFEIFFAIGLVAGGAVVGMMVYFIAKYRHIEGKKEIIPERMKRKRRQPTANSFILFLPF